MENKKLVKEDGTIVHYIKIDDVSKMHSWDGPAYIPQGNSKKGEYYLYGIRYTKEEWLERKKDSNGVPFYKTASGKSNGERV